MNSTAKYCGECGSPLPDDALYCGECGAAIPQPLHKQKDRPHKPRVPPRLKGNGQQPDPVAVSAQSSIKSEDQHTVEAVLSGGAPTDQAKQGGAASLPLSVMQWMAIWLVSWAPVGLVFISLHDFDTDLGGLYLLASVIGSGIGGGMAGLLTYLTLTPKQSSVGLSGFVPGAVGMILWIVGLLPFLLFYGDDDYLILALPILAVIFGVLVSGLAISGLQKKYHFPVTTKKKMLIVLWSVLSALLGVSGIILVWLGI